MSRRKQRDTEWRIPPWTALLLFLVLSPLAFLTGLRNDSVLDDGAVAWAHPAVRGLPGQSAWSSPSAWGVADSPWRPLATTTLSWNFDTAGAKRQDYLVTQVALRVIGGLLLFLLLWRLLRNTPAAFLWSLLATVHPATSEAVLRLGGRGELLGTVFILGATLAYTWNWRQAGRSREGIVALVATWVCYGLALVSFAQAWILPIILLAGQWVRARAQGGRLAGHTLIPIALMLLILVVYVFLRQSVGAGWKGEVVYGTLPWLGFFPKLADSVGLLAAYARLSILPLGLSTSYAHVLSPGGLAKLPYLIGGLAVAVLVILAVRVSMRRGLHLCAFGLLWWALGLIPCLPILRKTGSFATEMFLLLPLAGLILALGSLTARWIPGRRTVGAIVLGVLCVLFGLRTAIRAVDFRTDSTLLEANLRAQPKNADFLYQKGNLLLSDSRWTEAQSHYLQATEELQVDPRMWINLGITFHQEEAYGLAVRSLMKAVGLMEKGPKDPTLAYRTYYHAALSLMKQGNDRDAARYFEMALEVRPKSLPILANLGFVYAQHEKTYARAVDLLSQALELEKDPGRAEGLRKLIQEVEDIMSGRVQPGHEGHDHD
jgi:tetratricopeptide (TPR) repeat protein